MTSIMIGGIIIKIDECSQYHPNNPNESNDDPRHSLERTWHTIGLTTDATVCSSPPLWLCWLVYPTRQRFGRDTVGFHGMCTVMAVIFNIIIIVIITMMIQITEPASTSVRMEHTNDSNNSVWIVWLVSYLVQSVNNSWNIKCLPMNGRLQHSSFACILEMYVYMNGGRGVGGCDWHSS